MLNFAARGEIQNVAYHIERYMAGTPNKRIMLRAFRIENTTISEPHSSILSFLGQVLTDDSKAGDRTLQLNEQDEDCDLLSNFDWRNNNSILFGMMMRIIPADNGGLIASDLFERNKIAITDVAVGDSDQKQYKDHFYFALNNEFLVTNLSGSINIARLQTYLNWLLVPVRGERLFQFTELTKVPEGVEFAKIKQIEIHGGGSVLPAQVTSQESTTLTRSISNLSREVLSQIVNDTDSLEDIQNSQVIEAKLLLRIKRKPKGMAQEEYQRVMGAIATNITNDDGIVVKTKDGNKYTGEAIKVKKEVEVERTSGNRIVEEQLKQKMEEFLTELRTQSNG